MLLGSGHGASRKASVIRRANNSAAVVLMIPRGKKRQFLFVKGKAVASDQPEKLSVQRRGDVSVLILGENFERYEIVDALVVGLISTEAERTIWATATPAASPGAPWAISGV